MRSNTQTRIRNLNSRTTLTDDAIRVLAPSVFAGTAMAGVSDRYSFLPTIEIVHAMREAGWTPVHADQQRVRTEGRQGFQRHMVRFWRTDQIAVKGEYMPEVSVINAHDRSSAWQLPCGIYRFTCSNGMMVDDGTVEALRVRHSGCAIKEVVAASLLTLERLPKVGEQVERMRSREMSDEDMRGFSEKALTLRYDDPNVAPISSSHLLLAKRHDDRNGNLWCVFNRVQENLTMGGQRAYDRRDAEGNPYPKTRAVLGLSQNMRLNRDLWALAQTFLN